MPNQSAKTRRRFLQHTAVGLILLPLTRIAVEPANAADAALISPDDAAAKALKYVEDAAASGAKPGNKCENCALYQGADGSTQGPCSLFTGKQVKAAGWCTAWSPMM